MQPNTFKHKPRVHTNNIHNIFRNKKNNKQLKMKTKSKIFTDAELKSLNKRLKGEKKDKTGIFSSRVKPKVKEIINIWLKKEKELNNIIK